jgi:hypothetical protein
MTSTAILSQLSTVKIGTGTGGAKTITAVTQANPAVVTSTAHGLSKGDVVTISGVVGMTQLNGNSYVVQYVSTNSFVLAGVDSTAFTAYTSGGSATPVTYTKISNVKTFSAFDGQAADIDVSNLDSVAKEYLIGLQDMGQFTLELDLDTTDAGQLALLANQAAQTLRSFKLTLPNAAVATFNAFVKKVGAAGGVDQPLKRAVDLRITGAVVWS